MSATSIYDEIRHSINSGEITSLPAEKLALFSAALAKSQAYTHFGASQFRQVCETVKTLLDARSNEEALSKISHPAPDPATNAIHNWHNTPLGKIAIGVVIFVLGVIFIWVLNRYFNLGLGM